MKTKIKVENLKHGTEEEEMNTSIKTITDKIKTNENGDGMFINDMGIFICGTGADILNYFAMAMVSFLREGAITEDELDECVTFSKKRAKDKSDEIEHTDAEDDSNESDEDDSIDDDDLKEVLKQLEESNKSAEKLADLLESLSKGDK